MLTTRHRSLAASALIALLAALFVLLPLGEAVACASDPVDRGTAVAAAQAAEGHAPGDEDGCAAPAHGCVHGHCHASATPPPDHPAAAAFPPPAANLNAPSTPQLASTAPDQPTRPPRA